VDLDCRNDQVIETISMRRDGLGQAAAVPVWVVLWLP
jgi:hypothetical protein